MSTAAEWLGWLNTLGDMSRVRVLRLLDQQELGVGELARALQMPQSTVSRHLKPLFEYGWIAKRAEGTASLYRFNKAAMNSQAGELWELTRVQIGTSRAFEEDDARLLQVLSERRQDTRSYFGRVGGEWDTVRRELFGESFGAEALLHLVDPSMVVADLGCGTGNASSLLAAVVKKVIAVDRETAMLDAARKRLVEYSNVEFRKGSLESLPLKNAEVDAAVIVLVLHHVTDPAQVIAEAARVINRHGILLIVDMVAHDRSDYRHTMGHQHQGFDQPAITALLKPNGFSTIRYTRLRPNTSGKGPGLFVCTSRRIER